MYSLRRIAAGQKKKVLRTSSAEKQSDQQSVGSWARHRSTAAGAALKGIPQNLIFAGISFLTVCETRELRSRERLLGRKRNFDLGIAAGGGRVHGQKNAVKMGAHIAPSRISQNDDGDFSVG